MFVNCHSFDVNPTPCLCLCEAIHDYAANKARLKVLITEVIVDKAMLEKALATKIRTHTTEFEYKALRHAARGRGTKRKESITSRCTEFLENTEHDWKLNAHPDVVAVLEKILNSP